MDLKKVDIFAPYQNLAGWFTHKNADTVNSDGEIPGLNCGFHTIAGREEVEKNRNRLFATLGLNSGSIALAGQVHGNHVTEVDSGGFYRDTDALVTATGGITLAIQVADCAAVLMADPVSGVIGAAHAGWRGTVGNIAASTIRAMEIRGQARADRMLAYISPCISMEYFEVGPEVARHFPGSAVDNGTWNKPHVDLKRVIYSQLRNAGIPESQIGIDDGCTWRDRNRYFSYRREQGKAGRMLALIRLN